MAVEGSDLDHSVLTAGPKVEYCADLGTESWRKAIYKPLDADRKELRILKLAPNDDLEADPEGWLHTVSLPEAGFAAISYVWGDVTDQGKMNLDGQQILIGSNAHMALRYVRYHALRRSSTAEITLWIDAVCINQQDIPERDQQVPLMGPIFSKAAPVWLWTGQCTSDGECFLDIERRLAAVRSPLTSDDCFSPEEVEFLRSLHPWQWDAVANLLSARFWRRIWIFQEVILSATRGRSCVLLGEYEITYDRFFAVLELLMCVAAALWNEGSYGRQPLYLLSLVDHVNLQRDASNGRMKLSSILDLEAILDATDPRDYVYAWLGLFPSLEIQPRYDSAVHEIFQNATVALVAATQSLNPILVCQGSDAARNNRWPSWMIDFQNKHSIDRQHPLRYQEMAQLYHASASGQKFFALRRNNRLMVYGHRLWEVDCLMSLTPKSDAISEQYLFLADLRRWMIQKSRLGGETNDTDFKEAFVRTIARDRIPRRLRVRSLENYEDDPVLSMTETIFRFIDRFEAGADLDDLDEVDLSIYIIRFVASLAYFSFTVSPTGQLGSLHHSARIGDGVYILAGCSVPVVLRPVEDSTEPTFQIVGPAYIHGVMDGEAVIDSAKRVSTGDPDAYDMAFEEIDLV